MELNLIPSRWVKDITATQYMRLVALVLTK